MSSLLLVAILCTSSALGQVQVPCYGEGCVNVTVYLGPRWGSRVVMVPRTKTTTPPGVGSTDDHEKLRPRHRPIPPGGEFQVNFMDDDSNKAFPTQTPLQTTRSPFKSNRWLWWDPLTTRRPSGGRSVPTISPSSGVQVNFMDDDSNKAFPTQTPLQTTRGPFKSNRWLWWDPSTTRRPSGSGVQVVIDQYDKGTVDLMWRGYTGEDVKQVLKSLSEADRARVNTLNLDGNRMRHLPVLLFPVELEYGLQDLSLTHNSFSPPYLTNYSRFELSRLARLKTFNMSRCGLKSIVMPDLPSLEVLDLSYNELSIMPPSIARLDNVLQLFLRGNRITYISDFLLPYLTNLWVLDLGYNGLREIQGEPLENLRSLVTIKLDNNRLRSLPLLDSEGTKVVSLTNNSLQCSCSLLRWLSWQNRQLQYDYLDRCQDGNRTIPLDELRVWPEGHQHLCDPGSWGTRAWAAATLWHRRNLDIMRVIYKMVGVTGVVLGLLLLLKRRKALSGKTKPQNIPYNILDEQQVSHVDV